MTKLTNTRLALLFGVTYYLSVQLGMNFLADGVAFFWPASGVACAFFIFSEKRLWPLYSLTFIPAYLYPLVESEHYSKTVMGFLLLANWLQSISAGALVQWLVKSELSVNRLILQTKLVLLAAVGAPLIASLVGVNTFYLAMGQLGWLDYFIFWMIGNCVGILPTIAVCSVIKNWNQDHFNRQLRTGFIERFIYVICFMAVTHFVATSSGGESVYAKTIPYLIFPIFLYSSIRFKASFTSVLLLIFACYASYFAAKGQGPYISSELATLHNVLSFDVFIIILSCTCLLLAAIQYELELAQKQLTQEKDEALELNRLKNNFIGNVNHEIRTPVTGVLGATYLLKDTNVSPDQRRLLDVIDDAGKHLLCLINDVLDLTKLENNKKELEVVALDIEEILHSVVNSFIYQADEKGIAIYVDCQLDMPQSQGDETAIKQILSNLISNAVKFTEQGHIIISAKGDTVLHLQVRDTGIGIAKANSNRIFEGFVQEDSSMNRRFGGTGLGLTICERLATVMGGSITLTSQQGEGSCFDVHLPLDSKPQPQDPEQSLNNGNVLVYSNDHLQNRLLERVLENTAESFEIRSWVHEDEILAAQKPSQTTFIINWLGKDRQQLNTLLHKLKERSEHYILILPWSMETSAVNNISILYRPINQSRLLQQLNHGYSPSKPTTLNVVVDQQLDKMTQLNILLAEDNPVNSMIARTMLERSGCSVVCATDGEQAVQKANEHTFDMVLMDVQMPIMDGFTASREIKKQHPHLPVVAFTANYSEQLKREFSEAGMEEVLNKPFNQADLQNILNTVMVNQPLHPHKASNH